MLIDCPTYFIWNGIDSRDTGIIVNSYPDKAKAKEAVTVITIPGHHGEYYIPDNDVEPTYNSYLRTVPCYVRDKSRLPEIMRWLNGDGYVCFGNEPNRQQYAYIVNQISFSQILRGRQACSFTVPFMCRPYSVLYPDAPDIQLTTSGNTVTNSGDMRVPAVVTLWLGNPPETLFNGTITIGGVTAEIRDFNGSALLLDWEAQDCYTLDTDGTPIALANVNVIAPAEQQFLRGSNAVTWHVTSGAIDHVSVKQNWRYY